MRDPRKVLLRNQTPAFTLWALNQLSDLLSFPVQSVGRSVLFVVAACCWVVVGPSALPFAAGAAPWAPDAYGWTREREVFFFFHIIWSRPTQMKTGEYLRNLISSFFVSLSVMIFDVVTLTSTPSTMNLRVFFNVFFWRLMTRIKEEKRHDSLHK